MSKVNVLATGLACLLALTSCAQAPSEGTVTIITDIDFTSVPFRGTFEVTEGADLLGCQRGSFVDTPRSSDILKELTCETGPKSGTITVQFLPQDIQGPGDQNGAWSVHDATADFTGISGNGDFWVIYDEDQNSGVETLSGEIQLAP